MKLLPMYTDRIEKNRTEISFTVPHWDNSGVPTEKWQTEQVQTCKLQAIQLAKMQINQ